MTLIFRTKPYVGTSRSYCGKDRYRTVPMWHHARRQIIYYIKDKENPSRPLPFSEDRAYLKTMVAVLNKQKVP
jgi:hypothetical protein